MRSWGWFAYAVRDATRCPYCGKLIFPGATGGTWDYKKVGVPIWPSRKVAFIDVEVKAGHTSIPFSSIDERKREWAEQERDRQKWLWFCIGKNAVNAREHPRRTWLFPYRLFLRLEQKFDRKSIPYDCEELREYELEWDGDRTWVIPNGHPLQKWIGGTNGQLN
jgi:hypothetical protein